MFGKGKKIYSIFTGACPKCHQENMYVVRNPYILSETLTIHERCAHCNTKYKMEPSFFYGAMYVSYAVGIVFAFAAFAISYGILSTSVLTSFFAIVGTLILCLPIIVRLSRNIWINFFINYNKELARPKSSVNRND